MKTSDFRIGNIVNISGRKDTISEYWFKDLQESMDGPSILKCTEPIPLTEEWLLKFGFEAYGGRYNIGNCAYSVEVTGDKYWFNLYDDLSTVQIYFVHQLQNLYFALTGEELTIKS